MNRKYKLMGINDDEDTCSCCGKTNLKRVMWLVECDAEGNANGEVFPMGTTCGAKRLGMKQDSVESQALTEKAARYAQTLLVKGIDKKVVANSLSRYWRQADLRRGEFVIATEEVCYRVTAEKVTRLNMGAEEYYTNRLALSEARADKAYAIRRGGTITPDAELVLDTLQKKLEL